MQMLSTIEVESRTAVLNIGCMGRVTIEAHSDGWWEIMLESNQDGNNYFRTRGSMLPENQLMCHSDMVVAELPPWMFEQFNDKIDELRILFERDTLHTPEHKGLPA